MKDRGEEAGWSGWHQNHRSEKRALKTESLRRQKTPRAGETEAQVLGPCKQD